MVIINNVSALACTSTPQPASLRGRKMQTLEDITEAANVHGLRPAPFGDSMWARKRGGKINIEVGPKKNNRRMVVLSDTEGNWGSDEDADHVLGFLGDIHLPVARIRMYPIFVFALDGGSEAAVGFDLDSVTVRILSREDGTSNHKIEFESHEESGRIQPFDVANIIIAEVLSILANLGESATLDRNSLDRAVRFIARVRAHNQSLK